MGQDFNKDLALLITGSGNTTLANVIDLLEDYVFGADLESREVKLLVPFDGTGGKGMDVVLNQWAVGQDRQNPDWDIYAFVEPEMGHRSVASSKEVFQVDKGDALGDAMSYLVDLQKNGHEVAAVVLYDESNPEDIARVGDLKNYNSVTVLNLSEGLVDSFPGFKTTDEILKEEREREEFETKEKIRIAAEKEQEAAAKTAEAPAAKKAAAPRKRVAKKAAAPVETSHEEKVTTAAKRVARVSKDLNEKLAPEDGVKSVDELMAELEAEKLLARQSEPDVEEPQHKVGDTVVVAGIPFTKHSELPSELEPVKTLPSPAPVPDVWSDVQQAAMARLPQDKVVVSKEHLVELGEGIKDMSNAFARTIDALTKIVEGS